MMGTMEPEGIEPTFPACKAGVLPLNDDPVIADMLCVNVFVLPLYQLSYTDAVTSGGTRTRDQ